MKNKKYITKILFVLMIIVMIGIFNMQVAYCDDEQLMKDFHDVLVNNRKA